MNIKIIKMDMRNRIKKIESSGLSGHSVDVK